MKRCLVLLLLACGAFLLAFSSPALAESRAAALVRLLHAPGRAHPLADAGGRIPLSAALPPGVMASSIGLLEVASGVGAIRLPPDEVGGFAAAHPELTLNVSPRLHPLLDVSGTWTHVLPFRQVTGLSGRGVIVGVIDTGLDVRHPDFRTADGHTRVAWMLAGSAPAGKHPDLEQAFGCLDPNQSPCAVYSGADIDEIIAAGPGPLADTDGHGTHVTSIAAGNGGPSTGSPRFVGMAPEATLIVAAPALVGGFAESDILNAARFIFDRADAAGLPVVVNLSLGSEYGAHDGTSAIELGLSAFVGDDKPGRAIVVAAGNSGTVGTAADGLVPVCTGAGWICGTHTEVHVSPHELVGVPIVAGAAKDGLGFVWVGFHPGDNVSVGLEGPGGTTWVALTDQGQQGLYQSGDNQGTIVNDVPSANPAITTNSAVVVFRGSWSAGSEFAVLLQASGEGSGDAQLWVSGQRDATDRLFFERALRQGTINLPASAPGLLAVGCTVNRVQWTPLGGAPLVLGTLGADTSLVADGACFFSARGPTAAGVQKPEISAPGAFVAAAMGADADPRVTMSGLFYGALGCPAGEPDCAVIDDRHALASGTSMSAPMVTGAVALLLELDPTLTQARVTSLLQAGARRPEAHVPDPDQLGAGSLDLEGARRALLDTAGAPVASPSASWYTLSSAYARPDSSPVWGTVELRMNDGVAAGIDGSKLTLAPLQVGIVVEPLTEIRPGLYRFAVAARPEEVGGIVTVDVLYSGVSLGKRTLPVGLDYWRASDPTLTAVSGACSLLRSQAQHGPGGLALLAFAAAAAVRRLRKVRRTMTATRGESPLAPIPCDSGELDRWDPRRGERHARLLAERSARDGSAASGASPVSTGRP